MSFPVSAVTIPANLGGQTNGKLPPNLLAYTGMPGRTSSQLHTQALRSWKAMAAKVLELFAETLTVTSIPDAYRSYAVQEATFLQRYTTVPLAGRPSKVWNGVRYWQKPGTAMSAVPGTSNHGWGLAIDACLWRLVDGTYRTVGITANAPMFDWLLGHADDYGFSWEAQSEPWHLRLFTGDKTPQAVLDYEAGPVTPPPSTAPIEVQVLKTTLHPDKRAELKGNGDVALLQVHALGLYEVSGNEDLNVGSVDSDYGPKTQQAARVMQALNGIKVDAIVGSQSWAAFLNADGR